MIPWIILGDAPRHPIPKCLLLKLITKLKVQPSKSKTPSNHFPPHASLELWTTGLSLFQSDFIISIIEIEVLKIGNKLQPGLKCLSIERVQADEIAYNLSLTAMEYQLIKDLHSIFHTCFGKSMEAEIGLSKLDHAPRMQPIATFPVIRFEDNDVCLRVDFLIEVLRSPVGSRIQSYGKQV